MPEDPMGALRIAGDWIPLTPPFNTSGQPAINVPLQWTNDGIPIGVQIVAAYGREDLLIRVASQLEIAQRGHTTRQLCNTLRRRLLFPKKKQSKQ